MRKRWRSSRPAGRLFGGPCSQLLKAVTAIRLAGAREPSSTRCLAVAIFWIDAEDHDWDEVKACGVLDRDLLYRSIALGTPPGAHELPVARVCLDDTTDSTIRELEAALQGTEFTAQVLDELRRAYRRGTGMAEAFGRCWSRVRKRGPGFTTQQTRPQAAGSRGFARETSTRVKPRDWPQQRARSSRARRNAQVTPQGSLASSRNHGRSRSAPRGWFPHWRPVSRGSARGTVRQAPGDFSPTFARLA